MTKTERGLNKVTVELSDQALADLHAVQLKLRAKWQDAPGLESYEVTEADAVRTALAMCVDDGDRSVADLMPEGRTLNRNQQRLVQKTDEPGTDHSAHVWVLVCERPSDKHAGICCHQYGANGTDFHLRKCPKCQRGKSGLPKPLPDRRKVN